MNPLHPRVTTITLKTKKGKRLFGVTISRRVGFVKGLYISTLSLIGG